VKRLDVTNQAPSIEPIIVKGVQHQIRNPLFYKKLIQYKIRNGDSDIDTSLSPDELLWHVYSADAKNGFEQYESRRLICSLLGQTNSGIKYQLPVIKSILNGNILLPYIVLPSTSSDVQNFTKDNAKYKATANGDLASFTNYNEYSWYIFEIINYMNNNNQYGTFCGSMNIPSTLPQNYMSMFMNSLASSRDSINVKMKLGLSASTISFINKHPIFSHVFVGQGGIAGSTIYTQVMDLYVMLMTNNNNTIDPAMFLPNLSSIGGWYKQWVNSINIFDLYLNEYESTLMKYYQMQYIGAFWEFFCLLWMPFFKDMVMTRIVFAWRDWGVKTFCKDCTNPFEYYNAFSEPYNHFKDQMKQVVITTWTGMFTSSSIQAPAPPEGVS